MFPLLKLSEINKRVLLANELLIIRKLFGVAAFF
jgi:hypothetical protein